MIWTVDSILTQFYDGYLHLRREGFRATLKAVLRQLNASYEGYYYYINYKSKPIRGIETVEESVLFKTLWTEPGNIEHLPTRRFDKWNNMGEVRDGAWDKPKGKLENRSVADALKARFEEGKDWENIEFVKGALETVQAGESTWNGCHTPEDVKNRCEELDLLYERLQNEGFQSQAELHDTNPKSLLLSGSFDRSKTDIAVHVSRDGQFLFVDGTHRLLLAKILDIEEVPVRVVIRHKQWQNLRENVRNANDPTDSEDWFKRYRHHPDLQDVLSSNPSN